MFNKIEFANIIKSIKETYISQEDFSKKSGIGRTYLSQYMNMKLEVPPKPKILEKLANASKGITSYQHLMRICGYLEEICGDRLKGCRLKLGLSLSEVAHKVGTTPELLEKWENGNNYDFDFDVSEKLSKLYNVDIMWLIGSKNLTNTDFYYTRN